MLLQVVEVQSPKAEEIHSLQEDGCFCLRVVSFGSQWQEGTGLEAEFTGLGLQDLGLVTIQFNDKLYNLVVKLLQDGREALSEENGEKAVSGGSSKTLPKKAKKKKIFKSIPPAFRRFAIWKPKGRRAIQPRGKKTGGKRMKVPRGLKAEEPKMQPKEEPPAEAPKEQPKEEPPASEPKEKPKEKPPTEELKDQPKEQQKSERPKHKLMLRVLYVRAQDEKDVKEKAATYTTPKRRSEPQPKATASKSTKVKDEVEKKLHSASRIDCFVA